MPALEHDPADLRDRARDLLSRPPYRDGDDGPVTDLLRRVREAVARFLRTVLETITGETRVAWVVVAAGTALLLVVVWRATRGWNTDRDVAAIPEATPARSAAAWNEEADEHVSAGRWRDAIRCRYASLVVAFVEAGTLAEVPGRTVGELDREIEDAAPAVAAAVRDAGQVFEEVWYGLGHAGPDEHDAMVVAVDQATRALGRRREVRA